MMHVWVAALAVCAPHHAPRCVANAPDVPSTKEDPAKLYARGIKLLQAQDQAQAIPLLERCVQVDPASSRCYRALGIALAQRRPPNQERAKACYERYIQLQEQEPETSPPAELEDPRWMNPASRGVPLPSSRDDR